MEYRVAKSWFYYEDDFYQGGEKFKIFEYHLLEINNNNAVERMCLLKSDGRAYLVGEWEPPYFDRSIYTVDDLSKLEEWDIGKILAPGKEFTYLL